MKDSVAFLRSLWPLCWLLWLALPSAGLALTHEEAALLDRVRTVAAAPVDDFSVLGGADGARDGLYRYQLAFLGYGLCSIVAGEPELRAEARPLFTRLVEKMEQPTTIAYWKALGYGGDGSHENAMYRGHLNLMYALAHDRFGETRFDARFHTLSRELFTEITETGQCAANRMSCSCNATR